MTAPNRSTRSRWIMTIVASSIVGLIGSGFWFAAQFQSAAQQEADAKAPAPGPVFAEVAQRSLAEEVRFSGQIGPSTKTPVTVLAPPDASLVVVTGRPLEAGATVTSGQVLSEVNGRPLFGVRSPFSFYRDMGVGDRGPDVEALQVALAARSYRVDADGRFGSETAAAVKRWYEDGGYDVPTRGTTVVESDGSAQGDNAKDEGMKPGEAKAPTADAFIPISEVLAMPTDTAQVIQGLTTGQRLAVEGQPDFILGSADLVITVTMPVTDLGDVVAGDAATISLDGGDVKGTVGDIRSSDADEAPADSSSDAQEQPAAPEVTFTVVPEAALPASTGRAQVTVIKQIVAQDALIVPVLAVSDRGPGRNVLTKRQDDGTLVEVPVIVLGTLQGDVAVEPIEEGALTTGDRVRVG